MFLVYSFYIQITWPKTTVILISDSISSKDLDYSSLTASVRNEVKWQHCSHNFLCPIWE